MSSLIWTPSGSYRRADYSSESDLEKAILTVQAQLFGPHRIYLDIKKKIGNTRRKNNIPDGYLIDLKGNRPRLYVVENELAAHDPLRHIAVQILEFSLSFDSDKRNVRNILFEALQDLPREKALCQDYAKKRGFRNLDHLLDSLVFDSPFAALVIIDENDDELETVLSERFRFGVEVLELARYESQTGERLYQFKPFLADVDSDIAEAATGGAPQVDISELDTVVVPAREDGFQETFIGENCWYAIRMHGTMRPQIRYIAAYRIRPISAITHLAKVALIEPWKDTGKFIVRFEGPAEEIQPIPLVKNGRVKALQNLRYTTRERLLEAKTLDDIW